MKVLAIDPGTTQSAWVLWDGRRVLDHWIEQNERMFDRMASIVRVEYPDALVIEQIAAMGMAVGETTFETVFWSGRFAQAWGRPFHRIKRHEVKMHLCHHPRAKDANIRQALIDRLGPPGTKKAPGPTYGIKGDEWAALAVAVTWWDQQQMRRAA